MFQSHKSGTGASAVIFYTLFTFAAMGFAGTYSGGSGTAEDPYQIGTTGDLIALGNTPADYDKQFILTADIDLSGNVFTQAPIAPDTDSASSDFQGITFNGSFDGTGHILSNLTISSSQDFVGLFGYVSSGGRIRDLGLENVNITGKESVGSLVGLNSATITTCYATGIVSGIGANHGPVGGLVGHNFGTIETCYATCAVTGLTVVGGLVGEHLFGTIKTCYATGTVSGYWNRTGGLVGYNESEPTTACFWDIQTTEQAGSSGGRGLVTAQMKNLSNYQNAGWADKGWVIQDGIDYPRLSWENTGGMPIPPAVIPFAGSGTAEDPYRISTAEEFASLSWYSGILDKTICLIQSMDLSGVALYPIGDLGPFTGVFEGQGHILSNVGIQQPGSDYVGLFAIVGSGGQIRNLGLEHANITSRNYVGSLVGYNQSGTIETCYTTGAVSGSYSVGGIVGVNYKGAITSCYTTVAVSGSGNVGGLVGENLFGTTETCYATGTVSGSSSVGGLVGANYSGTIENCHSSAKIITYSDSENLGGLCGVNEGTIRNSHTTGNVGNYYDEYVGGLCGVNTGGTISGCYSSGYIKGGTYVGGLLGRNTGTVYSSYSTGDVYGQYSCAGGLVGDADENSKIFSCYCTGYVNGTYDVGGLVGQMMGCLSRCYTISRVSGVMYVGGAVGCQKSGEICNSYSKGNVSGEVLDEYIGGFVGGQESGIIQYCYSIGSVTAKISPGMPTGLIGGLVGDGPSQVIHSFWDTQKSYRSVSAGGEGKTTSQMKDQATFEGWNSDGLVWTLEAGNDYPRLAWENAIGEALPTYTLEDFIEGNGSKEQPYLIQNREQLNLIGCFPMEWDKSYELISDIDMRGIDGVYYNRIGVCRERPFLGSFDGRNHTIRNLTTNKIPYKKANNLGIFGYIECANIINVYVNSIDISFDGSCHGLLAGVQNGGIIQNCHSTGSVMGHFAVGGLVGEIITGTISKCTSSNYINCIRESGSFGGLVGHMVDGSITCCSANSNISDEYQNLYLGGLVGFQESGQISQCKSFGSIVCDFNDDFFLGGFVGYQNGGVILDCFSHVSVQGSSDSQCIGGFVGQQESGSIINCLSYGYVGGYSYNTTGGLVGYGGKGSVTNSFWDINASRRTKSFGGAGKTTAEMRMISTYINAKWDFVGESVNGTGDMWRMCADGVDYPRLSWEFSAGGDMDCPDGVALEDLLYLAGRWMASTPATAGAADGNGDGRVDLGDFEILAGNWIRM